jgi:hypothetical protein
MKHNNKIILCAAIWLGISTAIAGIHAWQWQFYLILVPTIFLLLGGIE